MEHVAFGHEEAEELVEGNAGEGYEASMPNSAWDIPLVGRNKEKNPTNRKKRGQQEAASAELAAEILRMVNGGQ